jgi:hypothetical protein
MFTYFNVLCSREATGKKKSSKLDDVYPEIAPQFAVNISLGAKI